MIYHRGTRVAVSCFHSTCVIENKTGRDSSRRKRFAVSESLSRFQATMRRTRRRRIRGRGRGGSLISRSLVKEGRENALSLFLSPLHRGGGTKIFQSPRFAFSTFTSVSRSLPSNRRESFESYFDSRERKTVMFEDVRIRILGGPINFLEKGNFEKENSENVE